MVASGDTVRAGDVLISGQFAGQYLGASGLVTAFVYAEGYGECHETETVLQPTGRGRQQLGLAAPGVDGWAWLLGADAGQYLLRSPHTERRRPEAWRKTGLAVELVLVEIDEYDPVRLSRTPQQALEQAQALSQTRARQALDALAVSLCDQPRLDSQSLDLADGVQRVHTVAVALADIGGFTPRDEAYDAQLPQ